MNIFVVDQDPILAARMLCDQHVCKMSIETAQLLSTAQHTWNPDAAVHAELYKPTHPHHPATQWVTAHAEHYAWTLAHALALWDEYTHRYFKTHKSSRLWGALTELPRPYPTSDPVPPPQCMPSIYQSAEHTWDGTVEAYRRYYAAEKLPFGRWRTRPCPGWLSGEELPWYRDEGLGGSAAARYRTANRTP